MVPLGADNLMLRRRPASPGVRTETGPRSEPEKDAVARKPIRRRAVCRIVLVSVVVACVYAAHPAILRAIAWGLIVDEPPGRVDYVWVRASPNGIGWDGDGCYDRAARQYREDGSCHLLMIGARANRLVEVGVVPDFESITRIELKKRGVPDGAMTAVGRTFETAWEEAHALAAWLDEHPSAEVLLLCSCFRSRRSRLILDTVLSPHDAARVRILALRDRRYDETNWWKSRLGMKNLFSAYVCLIFAWCQGEDVPDRPDWNPDGYERMVSEAMEGHS